MWDHAHLRWWRRDCDGSEAVELEAPPPSQTVGAESRLDWALVAQSINEQANDSAAVPLSDAQGDAGVLVLTSPQMTTLQIQGRTDLILPLLAAIRLGEFTKRVTEQVGRLKALHLSALHLQAFPHDRETILRVILTGVTAEEGLGFSRGVILLWNEKEGHLTLAFAVGAYSRTEAKGAWADVKHALAEVKDQEDRLEWLLQRVEKLSADEATRFCEPLNTAIRNTHETLDGSAVSECFRSMTPIQVGPKQRDTWRSVVRNPEESDHDSQFPFVCVPLRQGKTPIGVMVVDSRFLDAEMLINGDGSAHLEAFAELCVASLTNAEYSMNLAQALGETRRDIRAIARKQTDFDLEKLHRSLAHQLRLPLEGAATQLADAVSRFDDERGSTLLERIELASSFIQQLGR